MPAWSDLVQVLFKVADDYLLTVSSHGRERVREVLSQDSFKGTNPIPEDSTLSPNHLPQATLPNIITLGHGVPKHEFLRQTFSPLKHTLLNSNLYPNSHSILFHPLYLFSVSSRPQSVPEPFLFCQSAISILFLTHEIHGSSPPSSFVPLTSCHVYPPNPQPRSNQLSTLWLLAAGGNLSTPQLGLDTDAAHQVLILLSAVPLILTIFNLLSFLQTFYLPWLAD